MNTSSPGLGPYVLPPLPFAMEALEPVLDAQTLRLHHDRHHRAYVDNLNAALASHPAWLGLTVEELLRRLPEIPPDIRQTVREQGGGHANHQFFWKILTPGGAPAGPQGDLLTAIAQTWGSLDNFKAAFETAGAKVFGSGWVFLVCRPRQGFKLEILTLPNQESVLTLTEPAPGLLICDVWEHAYYLTYNNRRADWLKAFWGLVNWPYVAQRLHGIRSGQKQL